MNIALSFLNLEDLECQALDALTPMARDYFAGGARDEITVRANAEAWRNLCLNYRVLVDVSTRTLDTHILSTQIRLPILTAPTAFHCLAHPDGEKATAIGTGRAGTIAIISTLSTVALEEVASSAVGPLWFQLYVYRDRAVTRALVQRAEEAGYKALVLTVDAAEIGTREKDQRNGFHLPSGMTAANLSHAGLQHVSHDGGGSALSQYVRRLLDPSLTWADVEWLAQSTRLPIVVKGLVRADDAVRAVDHGAKAVVVSNHGGRQLDTAVPTAHALPRVARAVDGRAQILVDGGIRRGTDIVKALALGADAVLMGRPILWGLTLGGAAGVEAVYDHMFGEVSEAMALCGCPSIGSIQRDLVMP